MKEKHNVQGPEIVTNKKFSKSTSMIMKNIKNGKD
jgi:hypothetical protein